MEKIFCDNCEDGSNASLQTVKFTPVDNFEKIIDSLNSYYEGDLLSYEIFDDQKIIVKGTTYMIKIIDELQDNIEEFMNNNPVDDFIKRIVINNDSEPTISLASFVELLIAPNQSVEIYFFDPIYGNTSYTAQT
jgi:hypothetical protein